MSTFNPFRFLFSHEIHINPHLMCWPENLPFTATTFFIATAFSSNFLWTSFKFGTTKNEKYRKRYKPWLWKSSIQSHSLPCIGEPHPNFENIQKFWKNKVFWETFQYYHVLAQKNDRPVHVFLYKKPVYKKLDPPRPKI